MDPSPKILIIGAGVFGLSTALHLARRGYTNIHLFDSQDYVSNAYHSSASASCDENKIIRASYGDSVLYRDLAFEAIDEWEKWNGESGRKLWDRCGLLRIGQELSEGEGRTQANLRGVSDAGDRRRAEGDGVLRAKLDPLGRVARGLEVDGYFDGSAGFVMASEACEFALHLCRKAGVQTLFGLGNGVVSLIKTENKVTGILTADGTSHPSDLVIVACGGWTPSFLPETEDLIETTAGSIITFRLPIHRQDLWGKFAPKNFPVWCWNMSSYDREKRRVAGIFGFPRTSEGVVKLCFTGAQWTDYTHRSQESDRLISFPRTETDGKIPEEAMLALRSFCAENLPELLDLEPEQCRLC
ncbi:hypothetical protein PRZ48_005373 [Zasmidium cellare]|uniref:FAD dependent oxidoreductase domain-containing protein n=1 Tax=Zasmidium cellare TaxID=395010 RepID=A0ABR0ESJ3_ZASCE|nr:hypothetical protein PRZ48_005373 [Zasmidium cellare]